MIKKLNLHLKFYITAQIMRINQRYAQALKVISKLNAFSIQSCKNNCHQVSAKKKISRSIIFTNVLKRKKPRIIKFQAHLAIIQIHKEMMKIKNFRNL